MLSRRALGARGMAALLVVGAAACARGPATPLEAGREFLGASARGDAAALRKLVAVPHGTPHAAVEAAIRGRIALEAAMARVEEEALARFGADAASALALPRASEQVLRELSVEPEAGVGAALVRVPGQKPLQVRRDGSRWRVVLFSEVPSAAQVHRLEQAAASADAAAELTLRAIRTGACEQAECARAAFLDALFSGRSVAASAHGAAPAR